MDNLIALVTGGNRGIGKEICRQLAQRGVTTLLGARDLIRGRAAASEVGENAAYVSIDVTSVTSINHLVNAIKEKYGRLDILINNAGVMGVKPLADCTMDDLNAVFETNYYGVIKLTAAFLPLLKESRGKIINISSGMGAHNELAGGYGPYRLSKANLNSYTILLANDLTEYGVRVNAVCPGWVKTDMGGAGAQRTVERGADTAVWLALDNEDLTGKFLRDRKVIPW